MAPLTDHCPKPLVKVGGRALADRAIDRLEAAGVEEVVVNLHYMADMMEAHLSKRTSPRIIFSDERDALLETGGGDRTRARLDRPGDRIPLHGLTGQTKTDQTKAPDVVRGLLSLVQDAGRNAAALTTSIYREP